MSRAIFEQLSGLNTDLANLARGLAEGMLPPGAKEDHILEVAGTLAQPLLEAVYAELRDRNIAPENLPRALEAAVEKAVGAGNMEALKELRTGASGSAKAVDPEERKRVAGAIISEAKTEALTDFKQFNEQ